MVDPLGLVSDKLAPGHQTTQMEGRGGGCGPGVSHVLAPQLPWAVRARLECLLPAQETEAPGGQANLCVTQPPREPQAPGATEGESPSQGHFPSAELCGAGRRVGQFLSDSAPGAFTPVCPWACLQVLEAPPAHFSMGFPVLLNPAKGREATSPWRLMPWIPPPHLRCSEMFCPRNPETEVDFPSKQHHLHQENGSSWHLPCAASGPQAARGGPAGVTGGPYPG